MLANVEKKCHKFVDKSAHFVAEHKKAFIIGAVAVAVSRRLVATAGAAAPGGAALFAAAEGSAETTETVAVYEAGTTSYEGVLSLVARNAPDAQEAVGVASQEAHALIHHCQPSATTSPAPP